MPSMKQYVDTLSPVSYISGLAGGLLGYYVAQDKAFPQFIADTTNLVLFLVFFSLGFLLLTLAETVWKGRK